MSSLGDMWRGSIAYAEEENPEVKKITVENPSTVGLYAAQKEDVESGKRFYDITLNTAYNYQGYVGDAKWLPKVDNFLRNGVDNSVTKEDYRQTLLGVDAAELQGKYSDIYTENKFVRQEKERILRQKNSSEYRRSTGTGAPDYFAIGTVYLTIPPTQISVSDEAHNYRFASLRSPGEVVISSGRSTTRIDLEIIFNSIEDINYKLRPLVAQFKTTPFLPIENEYLRMILNPFDRKLVDSESQKDKSKQLREMQRREKTVNELIATSAQSQQQTVKAMEIVDEMYNKGWIDDKFRDQLIQGEYLYDPENIPKEELTQEDYVIDEFNTRRVSLKKFIGRHIVVDSPGKSPSLINLSRNLNDIESVQNEIDGIKRKAADLNIKNSEDRFTDRQMMSVLSQMVISTMPGFPEALACKLSLYVFNYDPFSVDCMFISGYNKNAATPDITKCDLFIDWYTKRWLTESNNPDRPSMSWYRGDPTTEFVYITKLNPVNKNDVNKNTIQKESILIDDGLVVTGISVSIKNVIQFLPILSCRTPTCQYMGSMNSDVQFSIEAVEGKNKNNRVVELSKMIERIRTLSRTNNRLTRSNFIYIRNDLLKFLAMPYYIIDNYTVDTVPGSPGLQAVTINFIEFKPGQEKLQDIVREGVTTQEEIVWTAKWMLEKANAFITSGGRNGTNAKYEEIYDVVANKDHGWFRKNNNIISQFMSGSGGWDDELKALRNTIRSRAMEPGSRQLISEALNRWQSNPLAFDLVWKDDFILSYADRFESGLNNSTSDDSFFFSELDNVSKVAATMLRDDIVRRILDVNRNPEINDELNKNRTQGDKDAGRTYCYPDLELPKYDEIPDGHRFMNTDLESGKKTNVSKDPMPAQTGNATVDPDFFFFKGSLWGNLDNNDSVYAGVRNGIFTYKKLALAQDHFVRTEALDEGRMASYLVSKQVSRLRDNDSKGNYVVGINESSIDGQWVKVTGVIDGGTISVVDSDNQTYQVQMLGYSPNPARAKESQQALSDYVMGKMVRVDLGGKQKNEDGAYLAQVMVYNNGDVVNINKQMNLRSKELGLNKVTTDDNPLSLANEDSYFQGRDIFIKTLGKNAFIKKLDMALENLPFNVIPAPMRRFGRLGEALGSLSAVALTAKKEDANAASYDAIGVVLQSAEEALSPASYSIFSLTNDLNALPGGNNPWDIVKARTNNYGINRFDRAAEDHVNELAVKIRQSQKDNTLRMVRAFPTFKFYFIEEDMPEWKRLDDKYSYQAIASIDITKNRQEAADVAVVRLFNTRGTLDRSLFGLHDPEGNYQTREADEAVQQKLQETREEQLLEEFILKTGTIIKIKMGYSSDPDLLDTVFTGMIAEIQGGDMIEVVAQGFGVELLNPTPKPQYKTDQASAFRILDKIITSPVIRHFGKTKWFQDSPSISKKLFRRSVPIPDRPGEFRGASWWRNIAGIRYVLGIREDPRDNNIWVPENSWLYNLSHGGSQTLITKDKTIWDVFREMTRRMPGYITTVLPFDNRATIYFGPPDFMYWYTDEKEDAVQKWQLDYEKATKKPDDEKIAEMVDSGELTKQTPKDFNTKLAKLGPFLTNLRDTSYKDKPEYQEKIQKLINSLNGAYNTSSTTPKVSSATGGEPQTSSKKDDWSLFSSNKPVRDEAASFARTIAQSDLLSSENDKDIRSALDFCASSIESQTYGAVAGTNGSNGRIEFKYIEKDDLYFDSNTGKYYTKNAALDLYKKKRFFEWEISNPARKLVRNYHYKDSFHHIVANNITATSQYLSNKITVEFGSEELWNENRQSVEKPPSFHRISAQVDDDIWPERVREKIVQEKNARTDIMAWNYALGNLWEEMRKMYTGHLTVLGDASIKPYDIMLISDYFTDMHGPIEVEQVTHHFSPDTGFITTIVPGLICNINNMLNEGSLVVAGAYMDNVCKFVENTRSVVSYLTGMSGIGNAAGNVAFWLSGLSIERREPISFTPLMYAGRPYIAGVEGMMKTSLFESVNGHISRFIKQRNRIEDTISAIWSTGTKFFTESLQNETGELIR